MHKKALIFIVNVLTIYIMSVFFAEIVNFIYITPYISAFFFFEALIIYGFFDKDKVIHMAFLFGVISDIISLNKIFFFSALFPLFVFAAEKIAYDLKLNRYMVGLFFYVLYAVLIYILYSVSIALLLFLVIMSYLFCVFINYLFYKINTKKKADGEER